LRASARLLGLDAFIRRDVEAVIALSDPECVFYPAFAGIMEGPYRGHAGWRQYFEDLAEFSEEIHGEYTELHDLGDQCSAWVMLRSGLPAASSSMRRAPSSPHGGTESASKRGPGSVTPTPSKPPGCGISSETLALDARPRRPLSPTSFPLENCIDLLDGDLRPPLDPLRVNAGSTQRQETAANAELTGITERTD
jgi:SnoaL-like domain